MGPQLVIALGVGAAFAWAGGEMTVNKGRGRALGIVLGFSLGLIGLGIIWLLPKNERGSWESEAVPLSGTASGPRRSSRAARERPGWSCDDCGTELLGSEKSCYVCRSAARAL